MKTFIPKPIPPEILSRLHRLTEAGETQDAVIAAMRAEGLQKMESIKMFRFLFGVSLAEAKLAVHRSQTWVDRSEPDEAFHQQIELAAEACGFVKQHHPVTVHADDALHTSS